MSDAYSKYRTENLQNTNFLILGLNLLLAHSMEMNH